MDPRLNPNASSDYLATQQHRDDLNTARNIVMQAEAADERGRARILQANGLDPDKYTRLKQIIGYPLNAEEAAAQQKQVEGTAATPTSTLDPAIKTLAAGGLAAAGPVSAGVGVASAVGGSLAGNEFVKEVGDLAAKHFPNHPYAAQLAGQVLGALGLGIGSSALAKVGQGTPGETAPAAGSAEVAPAGEAEAPTAAAETAPPSAGEVAEPSPQVPTPQLKERWNDWIGSAANGEGKFVYALQHEGQDVGEIQATYVPSEKELHVDFVNIPPENQGKYSLIGAFRQLKEQFPEAEKITGERITGRAGATALNPTKVSAPTGAESAPTQTAPVSPPAPPSVAAHSMEAMTAQAKATPMTAAQVAKLELIGEGEHALLKTPIDAMDTLRLHYYAGQKVSEVLEAARLAKDYGNQDAQAQFEQGVKDLSETVLPRWRAALHQAGLGLRVLGDPASAESGAIRDVQDAIRNSGGGVDRLVKALGSMNTVEERQSLLEAATATDWSAKGALYNLYLNSILSFNSAGKKLASDAANIVFQVPARGLAELGSRSAEVVSGNEPGSMGVAPGETMALIRGMHEGFGDALKYGLQSAVKGQPAFEGDVGFIDNPMESSLMAGSGFENTWWGRAIDMYGHIVSLPSRSIVAIDQFSKAMQYRMEMGVIAHRQGYIDAAQEGLEGSDLSGRAAELGQQYLEKPADWMIDQAMKTAKTNTFTQDLEGSLAKLDAYRRSSYVARTLMPFFKTPVNITLQGIRQSPLAPLSPTWRATVGGGGPEAALAMSKAALGSAVLGYLTYHVLQGRITGAPPDNLNADLRNDWLRDHQPYSIKLGDRWVSYQGLEPLSWLVGATADIAPAHAYLNAGETQQAVGTLVTGFLRELERQPMWGAVYNLVNAIDDAEKGSSERVGEFLGRQAGGIIPATISNYAGDTDPVRRQMLGTLDAIRNRIPWLKKNGLPTLDSFGDPVVVPPGFMWNEFPAYKAPTKGADSIVDKLIDLHNRTGFIPPPIPRALGGPAEVGDLDAPPERVYGATLTPEERNRWMELRGSNGDLKNSLEQMVKQPQFKEAADAMQANMIHGLFMAYQKRAEAELINERPEIRQRLMEAMARKKQSLQPRVALGAP